MLWLEYFRLLADALANYPDPTKNLYQNPKYISMFSFFAPTVFCRRTLAQIGDAGTVADTNMGFSTDTLMQAFINTGETELAQLIYFANGNSTADLHADIFTPQADKIQDKIQQVIDTHGEYDFDQSRLMAGYGFAALRGGSLYGSETNPTDTQRDFWLYFGQGTNHGHGDTLNLGIHAYGLDMAPDFGYPGVADGSRYYYNWGHGTIAHNTVLVNDKKQDWMNPNKTGDVRHFDDAGRVKVIDVDSPDSYYSLTSIYRRTVVMVEANDEVSYGIDFFRIRGGDSHLYAFHSLSDEISQVTNLEFVPQTMGTYAGVDVPYGSVSQLYTNGFDYLTNVRRAQYPKTGEFSVDFKVKDFRKTLKTERDLHLRMTMLNDFELSEVALANGSPADYKGNPQNLEFVLAKRQGKNLDSLFTTVFEPYDGEEYIVSQERVPMDPIGGTPGPYDAARAVKVTLKNGRVDYIVYATNNKVAYQVDGLFDFRGFVGVYTLKDGEAVYSYLNDGDLLDGQESLAAYTGTVRDFTQELVLDNSITVSMDQSVEPESLAGKHIYVNTGSFLYNGVYPIENAARLGDGTIRLGIGKKTLVRAMEEDGSYIHNIQKGQSFRIPLATVKDSSPVFAPVGEIRIAAGSRYTMKVSAESPADKELSYEAVSLPRGAQFDPESRTFTWTPDSSQIGVHHVAISASDGALTATVHFEVQVAQSGTGGGGGGATPNPEPDPEPNPDPDPTPNPDPDPDPTPGERFIDLGGYDWAKDAINELAEAGVIKGTSANTYSPGANITRADFALLLTRAFKLTSDSTENFADVAANKYYAAELAIAKANGIVNGIGNNKFKPEGQITRQDMMVMLERALKKLGYELGEAEGSELAAFSDAAQVADYAKEAVALLIGNGVVAGSNGRINPQGKATRAEVAVLLERVLKLTPPTQQPAGDAGEAADGAGTPTDAKQEGDGENAEDDSAGGTAE